MASIAAISRSRAARRTLARAGCLASHASQASPNHVSSPAHASCLTSQSASAPPTGVFPKNRPDSTGSRKSWAPAGSIGGTRLTSGHLRDSSDHPHGCCQFLELQPGTHIGDRIVRPGPSGDFLDLDASLPQRISRARLLTSPFHGVHVILNPAVEPHLAIGRLHEGPDLVPRHDLEEMREAAGGEDIGEAGRDRCILCRGASVVLLRFLRGLAAEEDREIFILVV